MNGFKPTYREISLPIFLFSLKKYKGDDEALLKKLNEFMAVNTNQSINDFKIWLKKQIKEERTAHDHDPQDLTSYYAGLSWILSLLEG